MKIIVAFLLLLVTHISTAQGIGIVLNGGTANYQGDLQELPYTFNSSGLHFGINATYSIGKHINLRGGIAFGHIKAADVNSSKKGNRSRNLSFENRLMEYHLGAEYNLFNLEERVWTPYVFVAAALYTHNPYAYDAVGKKIYLEPLRTEGQGLPEYPNRATYNLYGLSVPIGGGFKLSVSDNIMVGYEIGFRKTFTDYLDDVSTTYPDEVILQSRRGAKAVEMSYRGGEVFGGSAIFPAANTPRGSASNKDWYYFQSLSIGIQLYKKDGGLLGGGNRYRTKCPRY